jgi:hypothetical protein
MLAAPFTVALLTFLHVHMVPSACRLFLAMLPRSAACPCLTMLASPRALHDECTKESEKVGDNLAKLW